MNATRWKGKNRMKSFKAVMGWGVVVLLMAVSARAQLGLPVAESYEARKTGQLDLTVGAMLSDDLKCYAVRDTFGVLEDLRLFVDLGLADVKRNDEDLAVQAGLIYCLPIDVPVDLGLRAAAYWFNGNVNEITGASALLLASGNPVFEGLYVYGGGGFDYRKTQIDLAQLDLELTDELTESTAGLDDSENDVFAVVTFGALMPITEKVWFFAEATYDDEPFLAIGVRSR